MTSNQCNTLCPTIALDLEGVPPCVDENRYVADDGAVCVAVDVAKTCANPRDCGGCYFFYPTTRPCYEANKSRPSCISTERKDRRNIVWKLETEVNETKEKA